MVSLFIERYVFTREPRTRRSQIQACHRAEPAYSLGDFDEPTRVETEPLPEVVRRLRVKRLPSISYADLEIEFYTAGGPQ